MTSQLMVKINIAPFSQINKSKNNTNGEVMTLNRSQEVVPKKYEKPSDNNVRIVQLEQNIKFLQHHHQIMLSSLHEEINILRNRNRDLQFQLVFLENQEPSSSASSSDNEDKLVPSFKEPDSTGPQQVELLEKMIGDLKIQLEEKETKNGQLSAIVDDQKRKLNENVRNFDRDKKQDEQRTIELRRRVEDGEFLIKRLQQENDVLRSEKSSSSSTYYYNRDRYHMPKGDKSNLYKENLYEHKNNEQHQSSEYGTHNKKGNNKRGSYNRGNWFPHLQSQNYWRDNSGKKRSNYDKRNHSRQENILPFLNGNRHYQVKNGDHYHHNNNGDVRVQNSKTKEIDPS